MFVSSACSKEIGTSWQFATINLTHFETSRPPISAGENVSGFHFQAPLVTTTRPDRPPVYRLLTSISSRLRTSSAMIVLGSAGVIMPSGRAPVFIRLSTAAV